MLRGMVYNVCFTLRCAIVEISLDFGMVGITFAKIHEVIVGQ